MSLTPISQIKNFLIFSFLFILVVNSVTDVPEEGSEPTINSPIVPKPNDFLPSPVNAEKSPDDVVDEFKKEDLNLRSQQNKNNDLQSAVLQNTADIKTLDLITQKVQKDSKSGTEDDKGIDTTSRPSKVGSSNTEEKKEPSINVVEEKDTSIKDTHADNNTNTKIMTEDETEKLKNDIRETTTKVKEDFQANNNDNLLQDTNKDFPNKDNNIGSLNKQGNTENNSTIIDKSSNELNNANMLPTFIPTRHSFTINKTLPDITPDQTPIINPSNSSNLTSTLSSLPIIPQPPATTNETSQVIENTTRNIPTSNLKTTSSNDSIRDEPKLVMDTTISNIINTPKLISQINGDDKNNDDGDHAANSSTINPPLIPNETPPLVFVPGQQSLFQDPNPGIKNQGVKGGHFMSTMVTVIVMVLCLYMLYHNKKKIIAYVLEGKRTGGMNRRQPKTTIKYSQLDNVEKGLNHSPPSQSEAAKNFIF